MRPLWFGPALVLLVLVLLGVAVAAARDGQWGDVAALVVSAVLLGAFLTSGADPDETDRPRGPVLVSMRVAVAMTSLVLLAVLLIATASWLRSR